MLYESKVDCNACDRRMILFELKRADNYRYTAVPWDLTLTLDGEGGMTCVTFSSLSSSFLSQEKSFSLSVCKVGVYKIQ